MPDLWEIEKSGRHPEIDKMAHARKKFGLAYIFLRKLFTIVDYRDFMHSELFHGLIAILTSCEYLYLPFRVLALHVLLKAEAIKIREYCRRRNLSEADSDVIRHTYHE